MRVNGNAVNDNMNSPPAASLVIHHELAQSIARVTNRVCNNPLQANSQSLHNLGEKFIKDENKSMLRLDLDTLIKGLSSVESHDDSAPLTTDKIDSILAASSYKAERYLEIAQTFSLSTKPSVSNESMIHYAPSLVSTTRTPKFGVETGTLKEPKRISRTETELSRENKVSNSIDQQPSARSPKILYLRDHGYTVEISKFGVRRIPPSEEAIKLKPIPLESIVKGDVIPPSIETKNILEQRLNNIVKGGLDHAALLFSEGWIEVQKKKSIALAHERDKDRDYDKKYILAIKDDFILTKNGRVYVNKETIGHFEDKYTRAHDMLVAKEKYISRQSESLKMAEGI